MINQKLIKLNYDVNIWHEKISTPVPTLQTFITNKCNKRCTGCFYAHNLGKNEMSITEYKKLVEKYENDISKVILLGGEPTMHPKLSEMCIFNQNKNIKTTIYTNGFDLVALEEMFKQHKINASLLNIRVGILGLTKGEKNLLEIQKTNLPVTIVYMLRQNNIHELLATVEYAEKNFNCQDFYISTIRDIATTGSFWLDTGDTISNEFFAAIIQNFLNTYKGNIKRIHIAKRGVLTTENQTKYPQVNHCRYINVFPDGKQIICPFDICKQIYTDIDYTLGTRKCNKNHECLLQKIVLERN